MKQSRRARRMARSHLRNSRTPAFNLVSLMDIFTILVFFLLVNSSDGEVLPTTKNVQLPESTSEEKPRSNVVVMVTQEDILVQGKRVITVSDLQDTSEIIITSLQTVLEAERGKQLLPALDEGSQPVAGVTIMGTKQIPYSLLKRVMATCTQAGYGSISLAVLQKPLQES